MAAGLPAALVGATSRARIGFPGDLTAEVVKATFTTATSWALTRAAEDAARFPAKAWTAGTPVSLVVTAGGLAAVAGLASPALVDARTYNLDVGRTATQNYTSLMDAIAATPVGGTLYVPNALGGSYAIDDTPVVDKTMTVAGDFAGGLHGSRSVNGVNAMNIPLTSPYLVGSVIRQVTAGKAGLKLTGSGLQSNLRDVAVLFDPAIRFKNTGHGIDATPTQTIGAALDNGLHSAIWENVWVFGHDGNHYGFYCVNQLCCSFYHLRAFGGGVFCYENRSDQPAGNYGNLLLDHLYGQTIVAGTAHGVYLKISNGTLNMLQFNRCQATTDNMTGNFPEILAGNGGLGPATSAQKMLMCDAGVKRVTFVQHDFETGVGGNIVQGTGSFFFDWAGLANGTTTGGPGAAGGSATAVQPNSNANVSIGEDLTFRVDVATPNAPIPLGFYHRTKARSVGMNRARGTAFGVIARGSPRPLPRENGVIVADFAQADLDTDIVRVKNVGHWEDVAGATFVSDPNIINNLTVRIDVNSLAAGNGNPISTATNQTGLGNFTAAGSARPTWSTATQTPNGKAGAVFDGTANEMASTISAGPLSFTDFYVLRVDDVASAVRAVIGCDTAGPGGIKTYIQNGAAPAGGKIGLDKRGSAGIGQSSYPMLTGQISLVVVRYDGTTLTVRVDCTPMGSVTNAQTMAAGNTVWGGGGGDTRFKGTFFYWLRYQHATLTTGALTDDQVKGVERWLRDWGNLD